MGALTSNGKRNPYSNTPDFHVSKKPRLSLMQQQQQQVTNQTLGFPNSTVSRISRYPETAAKFRREVHAPCRPNKFGIVGSKSEKKKSIGEEMGNFLSRKLDSAKKRAFSSFRYLINDKPAVIEEDNNELNKKSGKEVLSDDSSIQEVEAIEEDNDGFVGNFNKDDNDVKIVEERSVITIDGDIGQQIASKKFDSLAVTLNNEEVLSSVEAYKKLLETAERRNPRLESIDFEIKLTEKKWSIYQSSRPAKKPEVKEIPQEPFIPLTKEEETEIKRAFSGNNRRKVLVSHKNSNIDITGELLQCLVPGAWLNDEVINLYLELLKEREKREPEKFLKCHFFNTFFYKKLAGGAYDYKSVRRWTTERKLGYFLVDCDKIFVPVHREIHWCLAIINKRDQKFQYLDSLKGRDMRVLEILAKYYVEEVKDKSKKDIDVSNWEREFLDDLPEQQNGYDCGVFMIKYADFYSRDIGLCFSQDNMPYFRMRTAKEILRLKAD